LSKKIIVLKKLYKLFTEPIFYKKLLNISSVNDSECIAAIKKLNLDVIIVNGTRIISSKVMQALFINTHTGITLQYRVHGAYWVLVSNDKENCGVIVDKLDQGIDTGEIITQCTIEISKLVNFITYLIQKGWLLI
jgi:methionyl-tRNA formyltransferase